MQINIDLRRSAQRCWAGMGVQIKDLTPLLPLLLSLVLLVPTETWAFDASKMPEGLFYNATNVNDQLWTPLVLVEKGHLIDPFLKAQNEGLVALEGKGRTTFLRANSAFMFGVCNTKSRLGQTAPIVAKVPTVYVAEFDTKLCGIK